MKHNKVSLRGRLVGVAGLGTSGVAAANRAAALGARVLASDNGVPGSRARQLRRGITTEFGGHTDALLGCDIIIKSPGIHGDLPILRRARRRGIPVIGEIEFAARYIRPRRIVAVTGTNGKTTTTALMGAIFAAAGGHTLVGGNIGTPLAALVPRVRPSSTVVLELSSYQLEDAPTFHPSISAILNITPDHLEHHGTMRRYAAAKARMFANQTARDVCVLNYDDLPCRRLARRCPARVLFFSRKHTVPRGAVYHADEDGHPVIAYTDGRRSFRIDATLRLPGMHNVENVLACVAMAGAAGVPPGVIAKTIAAFPGVEHRIEFVRSVNGVRYYNDSKGTNVDSTRVALESFREPVWLILGGRDKGAPYAPLIPLVRERVRGILLIGEAASRIRQELAGTAQMYDCGTLDRALARARELAHQGDVVLLSPACASFDQFADYEDRGRQFKRMVRAL